MKTKLLDRVRSSSLVYTYIYVWLMMMMPGVAIATPSASFTANQTTGCTPLSVQFTSTSTGAVSYYWDMGNGNTSTLQNPSNLYTTTGSFTVTLTVDDGMGGTDVATYTNYITVVAKPNANFVCGNTSSCLDNNSFTFTNLSTGAATYLWDFGDGTISTLQSPIHSFLMSGTFTVTLIATSAFGCTDQKIRNQYITIYDKPVATISVPYTSSCDPATVFNFSCTTTGAIAWLWSFGDGTTSTQQNPVHTFGIAGSFNVSLIVTNSLGCKDTVNAPTTINVSNSQWAYFAAVSDSGCAPFSVEFWNPNANVLNCLWNFGDGSTSTQITPTHVYTLPGAYTVSLIINTTNGCTDTVTRTNYIFVGITPTINFSSSVTSGCAPVDVQFINLSTNSVLSQWNFGDGSGILNAVNPLHTYTGTGAYTVTLQCTGPTGCRAQRVITNMITTSLASAMYSATPRIGCPPLAVNFTSFPIGNISNYFWDFGDGSTSTLPNPSHTYIATGVFNVLLVVTDSAGCRDTVLKPGYVQTLNPAANYIPPATTVGCAPLTTQFTDASVGSIAWLWDFGDGITSTLQNPIHTYTTPGFYTVSLTTQSAGGGCTQTISNFNTFDVRGGYAGFTDTVNQCPPYIATFTDTSLNAVSWLWDFGDGTTSTLQNPIHTYAVPGYHSTSLTITTADGCTYTTMQSNSVYFPPFGANFYAIQQGTTFPITLDFYANSVGATGWFWTFGDSSTSTLENPVHTYQYNHPFNVTLTITNGTCTLTYAPPPFYIGTNPDTTPVDIGNPGTPVVQRGCTPLNVSFTQTFPGAVTWHWDFGDGDTSNIPFPNHIFYYPGIYTVTLTTTDTLGLTSVLQMDSIVQVSGPVADFGFLQLASCNNTQITLTDSSLYATHWLWNFGDGTTDTTQNPVHTYTTGQSNYMISLTVSDTSGCSSSLSTSIFASFISPVIVSENEICGADTVHFQTSLQNFAHYHWDFGDGDTSDVANATHIYTSEGSFNATLTVTDNTGCTQTFSVFPAVTVSLPVANFASTSATQGCKQLTIHLNNLSSNADSYYWNFGDGSSSTAINPMHLYATAGTYDVTLTVYRGNCVSIKSIPNYARVDTAHAEFTYATSGICSPVTYTFTDLSANPASWKWEFGNGDSSFVQNPVYVYDSMPQSYITLTMIDVNGCTDTARHYTIAPLLAAFNSSADSGCVPFAVTFTNTSASYTSSYWDFGDGDTSSATSPVHTYTQAGTYNVMLIVNAGAAHGGCTDTLFMPNLIRARNPISNFSTPDVYACAPSVVNFVNTSLDGDSYLWDFGDGTTSTNDTTSHIYNAPGLYTVSLIVSVNVGCSDSLVRQQYIRVLGPVTNFTASAFNGCVPFTVDFTDHSLDAIDWSWNFGDGYNLTSQISSHTFNDTGSFTVTLVTHDTAGCSSFYELPQQILVHETPVAHFTVPNSAGCIPFATNFTNSSSTNCTYLWNFGDGTTSTDSTPSHAYLSSGFFNATLIATNQFGCSDTFASPSQINVQPTPSITFNSNVTEGCTPLEVYFTSTATNVVGANYLWDFGGGITSMVANPTILFTIPGFYNVSLTITNSNGCDSNVVFPAYIHVFDTLPPNITNILSVSVISNTTVDITWENNPAIDLGAYILYRLNNNSGYYENIHTDVNPDNTNFSLNPMYTDVGLNTLHNVYTYKLQTLDICGNTIGLDQLTAHSTINVSSEQQGNDIKVDWNAYGGCPVSSYQIYRTEPGGTFMYVATVPSDSLNYTDTTFDCPHDYSYRITATDLCGNPYVSNSDTSVTKPYNTLANQIVDVVRSTVENNQFVLTEWKQPTVYPEKVLQFDVYRSIDNVNYSYLASVPSVQTDFSDYNVDVQLFHYYYKILVINVCDIDEDLSPLTSSILLKGEMTEDRQVHLKWSPYKGWANGVDNYVIEKRDVNGNWQLLKQINGNTTGFDYQE